MKRVLAKLFRAMSLRERFLLVAFIWVGLLIWILELIDQTVVVKNNYSLNKSVISQLEDVLTQQETADLLLQTARSGLDGTKTFTAAQLVGRVDSIARENNLNSFDISSPSTNSTELFSFHSVRINIKRAQLQELIQFDNQLKQFSPYIALTQFQITANTRDPRQLDAIFEFVSFELNEDVL